MSEVIFILGAGASAHTEAPTMRYFYDAVCDLRDDRLINDIDKEAFDLIIKAKGELERILVKVDMDLNNLETIFSLIEMGKLIDIFPGNIPVDKLHKAIQRVIVRTIELKTNCYYRSNNDDIYDLLLKEIKLLWGQRGIFRSSILTFNYDVAIDLAVERHVGAIDYCLHENASNSPRGYKLLKLHGSFNWAKYKKDSQGDVIPISVKKFVDEYYPTEPARKIITTADLPLKKEAMTFQMDIGSRINNLKPHFYSGLEADMLDESPLIVPPTWSKTGYHTVLGNVWAQAAREISGAKYIIVIGYSLPPNDLFFQYLLALGMLNISRLKVFWVVDKGEEIITRYRKFIGEPIRERLRVSQQAFDQSVVGEIHQFLKANNLMESGVIV